MKKGIQIIFLGIFSFLIAGCTGSKELKKAYEKMQTGKELTGYQVDYRLYGTYQEKNRNDIVRIQNANGKATIKDRVVGLDEEENKKEEKIDTKLYEKPEIYLEGLKHAEEKSKKEEKIAGNTYTVYEATVDKKVVKEMIHYTSVKDLDIKEDINATVSINKDGYVYRIIYELDKENALYLNVSFFAFEKNK